MSQNIRLADIYIKIYHKKVLTMDDLIFLAKYDPECFSKTCENMIYKVPETKKLMEPQEKMQIGLQNQSEAVSQEPAQNRAEEKECTGYEHIAHLFDNLKKMEILPVQKVSADRVKDLLGNLYMEMLFPHSGTNQYFKMERDEPSVFNKKV